MILSIKEKHKTNSTSKHFVDWSQREFKELLHSIRMAKINEDGTFDVYSKALITDLIISCYRCLCGRFELDKAMIEDELATVIRMLNSLPAEQFRTFAEIAFEPYINLESDTTIIYEG